MPDDRDNDFSTIWIAANNSRAGRIAALARTARRSLPRWFAWASRRLSRGETSSPKCTPTDDGLRIGKSNEMARPFD